ncbi:phospholipase D family protein [Oceaniradius stylonematis]|uniref:phospholipase D family protein n=1 Tax=Oceaniradius stylonematis TaxID=2184161 RepID=UPI0035CFDF4F
MRGARVTDELTSAQPLVTAEQAFPAMEELVLEARERLDLALHIFSPRTKTRSSAAHSRHIGDWGALIADALRRGVRTRLLLNDFDPVGAPEMHAAVWERLRLLADAVKPLPHGARTHLTVLVAHPGGQSGMALRTLIWPVARVKQARIVSQFRRKGRNLPPGLAGRADRIPRWPPRRNFTATLHQKFLVADKSLAIVGGLDIDERRYDDPDHNRSAPETWHDVSVGVAGGTASDLADHFDRCWNIVRAEGASHAPTFVAMDPDCPLRFAAIEKRSVLRTGEPKPATPEKGMAVAATLPRPGRSPFRFGPVADLCQLERAHLDLIARARRYVYLESQFFRSSTIRDGLIAALGRNRALHAMLLLPGAPDVIAYEGEKSGVQRYGEWLQMRSLNRLTDLFGDRFAAYCITNDRTREEEIERDALYGKSMVYVHSKVAIADDDTAIVSSANLNGRSMRWDTEAGIVARDATFAASLREALWRAHIGGDTPTPDPVDDPAGAFGHWRTIADARRIAGAEANGTGIVPFPLEKTRRFAKRHILIPQEMV